MSGASLVNYGAESNIEIPFCLATVFFVCLDCGYMTEDSVKWEIRMLHLYLFTRSLVPIVAIGSMSFAGQTQATAVTVIIPKNS